MAEISSTTVHRWLAAWLTVFLSTAVAGDIQEQHHYYAVNGDSPASIWADMRAKAPAGQDGNRYNATTAWKVRWHFPFERNTEGCTTGDVTVDLTVTYTLPRWERSSSNASATVANQWDRYIQALELHEDGHADFGRRAARRIQSTLQSIPAQASCDALQKTANAEGQRILVDMRPEEREYDRRTQHGATQGTAFFRDLATGKGSGR